MKIKTLELSNFKGFQYKKFVFNKKHAVVTGRNGAGKSTVLSAWSWLLTGRDQDGRQGSGRSPFTITPTVGDNVISGVDHKVTAVIDHEGLEYTLERKIFSGKSNTTTLTITDPEGVMQVFDEKGWAAFLARMHGTRDTRVITDPEFLAGKARMAEARDVVMSMLNQPDNLEIIAANPDLQVLGQYVEYFKLPNDFSEWQRHARENTKAMNDRLKVLEALIDESTALMPDLAGSEEEFTAELEELIKSRDALLREQEGLTEKFAVHDLRLEKRGFEDEMNRSEDQRLQGLREKVSELLIDVNRGESDLSLLHREVDRLSDERDRAKERLERIRESIAASEEAMVKGGNCPTCNQPLQGEGLEKFRAALLKTIAADRKRLQEVEVEIKSASDKLEELSGKAKAVELDLSKARELHAAAQDEVNGFVRVVSEEDAAKLVEYDELIAAREEEQRVERERIRHDLLIINGEISDVREELSNFDAARRVEETREGYRNERREIIDHLSDYGDLGELFKIFIRDRGELLQEQANALVPGVEIRLFEWNRDGTPREACEFLVDGVPFYDLNRATKLRVGLRIIEAVNVFDGFSGLPVTIDNVEGVEFVASSDAYQLLIAAHVYPGEDAEAERVFPLGDELEVFLFDTEEHGMVIDMGGCVAR